LHNLETNVHDAFERLYAYSEWYHTDIEVADRVGYRPGTEEQRVQVQSCVQQSRTPLATFPVTQPESHPRYWKAVTGRSGQSKACFDARDQTIDVVCAMSRDSGDLKTKIGRDDWTDAYVKKLGR